MYADRDFPTKKALKEAILAGKEVFVYSPGPFPAPTSGETSIEGPHYPKPHTWYARVRIEGGRITKVIG